ncbi:response regulator [Tunturibacter empetritectus]|uniref:DNA-binding response OmpR family regulator n=1 Tax=Tunturiibacter empetritectus TaxID=3069691 RepID=A0A7W8IN05_9BACT|nr:response regulator [Edaphobacter lichenicola]MBB5319326.1 DNA-binding response OmpR family regulator [Edaphobacter lichenicola]
MRILLVEDEIKVGNALSKGLQAEGYEITWAQVGEESFFHASSCTFDLIILDVMLPGRDGIEVLNLGESEANLQRKPSSAFSRH